MKEPSVNKQLSFMFLEMLATGVGWILLVLSGFVALMLLIGVWIGIRDDSSWFWATIIAGIIGWFLRWWGNESFLLRNVTKRNE